MALSTLRSYITGEPMTEGQHEYRSRVTRTVGETYTAAGGTVYRVLATRAPQPHGQLILVEKVR